MNIKHFLMLCFIGGFLGYSITWASWQNVWWTPDQMGVRYLKAKQPQKAAEVFSNNLWKGYAEYRAGNYKRAAVEFAKTNSALANYNRGNALAKLGDFHKAIAAYALAIKQKPDYTDAKFNKKLLENLQKNRNKHSNKQKNKQSSATDKARANFNQDKSSSPRNNENENEKSMQKSNKRPPTQNNTKKDVSEKAFNNKDQMLSKKPLQQGQKQAIKQWMQKIPENPGGLLKEKFWRDHLRLEAERNQK